jgi:pyruvate carboxylase subunit B
LLQGIEGAIYSSFQIIGLLKINRMLKEADKQKQIDEFNRMLEKAVKSDSSVIPMDSKAEYTPLQTDSKMIDVETLKFTQEILEKEGIEVNDENIFIAASCKEKGIASLKGEAKVNVRKIDKNAKQENISVANSNGEYTVVVNGEKFNVQVSEGLDASVEIKSVTSMPPSSAPAASGSGEEIKASLPGAVFKIVAKVGDSVNEGDVIVILEAMKMEIEIVAPKAGVVSSINVNEGQTVENGQLLAVI